LNDLSDLGGPGEGHPIDRSQTTLVRQIQASFGHAASEVVMSATGISLMSRTRCGAQRITPQKSVEDAPHERVRGALRSIGGTPG